MPTRYHSPISSGISASVMDELKELAKKRGITFNEEDMVAFEKASGLRPSKRIEVAPPSEAPVMHDPEASGGFLVPHHIAVELTELAEKRKDEGDKFLKSMLKTELKERMKRDGVSIDPENLDKTILWSWTRAHSTMEDPWPAETCEEIFMEMEAVKFLIGAVDGTTSRLYRIAADAANTFNAASIMPDRTRRAHMCKQVISQMTHVLREMGANDDGLKRAVPDGD